MSETRPNGLPKEVFLSHSSHDQHHADDVASVLRAHGVPFWYSATSLRGAQEWHDEIGLALQRCDWFLVVLTPQAVASMWVRREFRYALREQRLEERMVPLLFEDCDLERLSWPLPAIQYVDFRTSLAAGFRELLRIWGISYREHRP